jgi:putative FmdB family regulatory protein
MPLYEYECGSCGRRFERIQKFSDPPLETCPHCSAGPVKRLISSPAIHFKGSGWYINDYARKDTKDAKETAKDAKETKDTKESKETSTSSTTSSSESKPASKPSTDKT